MAEQKNTYTLPIAGTMLNIRTTDSEEYVRRLAAQLDDPLGQPLQGLPQQLGLLRCPQLQRGIQVPVGTV